MPNNFEKFRDGLTVEQFVKIFFKHVQCYDSKKDNPCPARELCHEYEYQNIACSEVLEQWAASEDEEVAP